MPQWCPAKVVDKKVWTEGLFTLTIETSEVEPFLAGQFLHLALGEGDDRINRPYSVASPHGSRLEFFVVLVPEGQLTPKLWALNVNDTVQVSQRAAGSFTLTKTPDAEALWLIATGTGLAPYIAMLRTEEPWNRFKKIVVVHGVRYGADLAYTNELLNYQKKYGNRFQLIQALTREEMTGKLHGRIPSLLENGQLEELGDAEISAENCSVLLCGNPAMLDEMEAKLSQRSMKKHRSKSPGQIVLERYW